MAQWTTVLRCACMCAPPAPFWLQDNNPSTFSDSERATILSVWRIVAEDYAPFDVDVTTEDPAATNTPLVNWVRAVIGGSYKDCECPGTNAAKTAATKVVWHCMW